MLLFNIYRYVYKMTEEKGEQPWMETARDRGRGGGEGQMNRDIVRFVKRKQQRWQAQRKLYLCLHERRTEQTF